jgi:hypothetical protein
MYLCFYTCFSLQCSEPFFLHPPAPQHQQPDGLYINPAHSSSADPFYLHNPRDLVYNRVKDLFEPPTGSQPPAPTISGVTGMSILYRGDQRTLWVINLIISNMIVQTNMGCSFRN